MRQRADAILVDRGLFPSREQARAAILAGRVRVAGQPVTKAGQPLDDSVEFDITPLPEYVSRGGHKLEGALKAFDIDVSGKRAIDVGASTGGFTDRLLKGGAISVTAVDVGYGQLAWSLRTDERVTVVERTNIRTADPVALGAPFELAVVDVSFISLEKVLPALCALLAEDGEVVALVKPQFEAGKGRVGKKGVVRDPAVHRDVLERVIEASVREGFGVRGLTFSPIRGPEGNIEFWIWLARGGESAEVDPAALVEQAHDTLGA